MDRTIYTMDTELCWCLCGRRSPRALPVLLPRRRAAASCRGPSGCRTRHARALSWGSPPAAALLSAQLPLFAVAEEEDEEDEELRVRPECL